MDRPLQKVQRFFRELKRRNVYRVTVTYAVVAFVVWQAASFLFTAFDFPGWTVDFVVVLTVLGFPVALVLAWAFELTPEGVRYTTPAPSEAEDTTFPEPSVNLRTVFLLVAGLVLLPLGGWWLTTGGDGTPGISRLAVLPMSNLMNDPSQEYFVEAMHHELIAELQQSGLPVIARTSVLGYRDGETPIREIGEELGVDAVVEGAVLRTGADSVEIDASIVDPKTEESIWTGSVAGNLQNVESLYRKLSRTVADEIQAQLSPEGAARLKEEAGQVVPRAYDAYLNGVYHAQRFTPEELGLALDYFERALSLDSTYAPAYVGVARVWQFRAQAAEFTGVSPLEARRHIRPALDRALGLDSTLAEAHMAVGWLRTWNEWKFAEGLNAFERAVRFNPGHAEARVFYGHLLAILGRWEEAREQAQRAVELDPLNPFIASLRGVVLSSTRRYEETIEFAQHLYREHPEAPGFARTALITAYHMLGRHEDAFSVLEERYRSRDEKLGLVLRRGFRDAGYRGALRRLADTLVTRNQREGEPRGGPYSLYAMAGEEEEALRWLERAVEARSQGAPYMGVAPVLEPLHDRRRFQELARQVGVPVVTHPRERGGSPTTDPSAEP